jgi:hypothetical protein
MKKDPENLEPSYSPALINFVDESQEFVAHQKTTEEGWLYVMCWNGSRKKIPPHRIAGVQYVETVRKADDSAEWQEVQDEALCRRADKLAGLLPEREAREVQA